MNSQHFSFIDYLKEKITENYKKMQYYHHIDTYEVFPLPVAPRIALSPGLNIPLSKIKTISMQIIATYCARIVNRFI